MSNSDTAIQVIDQSPAAMVEYSLSDYPEAQYNRLIPTDVIGMPTDLIRPIVKAITLDLEKDTYASSDLPEGHRAPNARGLARLADVAGVDFPDSVRTDDGSNPKRAVAKVWATVVDATGRTRTVVGTRDYDLDQQKMSDKQRERAKSHVFENAETRARHRALRLILGLGQSYSVAELRKPFAVVSFVPNMQHPELREAYKQALLPAAAAAFGAGAAKQLAAGGPPIDLDELQENPKNVTPTQLPGEKLAKASAIEEPDWMRDDAPAAPKPSFLEVVRTTAHEGDDPEALATDVEKAPLRTIFENLRGRIGPGIDVIWPGQSPNTLSKGQARALSVVHYTIGDEAFGREWQQLLVESIAAGLRS